MSWPQLKDIESYTIQLMKQSETEHCVVNNAESVTYLRIWTLKWVVKYRSYYHLKFSISKNLLFKIYNQYKTLAKNIYCSLSSKLLQHLLGCTRGTNHHCFLDESVYFHWWETEITQQANIDQTQEQQS